MNRVVLPNGPVDKFVYKQVRLVLHLVKKKVKTTTLCSLHLSATVAINYRSDQHHESAHDVGVC